MAAHRARPAGDGVGVVEVLMPEAHVCEKTICLGQAEYRVTTGGKWTCLMWGWWPDSNGTPSYRWMPIPESKVPEKVRALR